MPDNPQRVAILYGPTVLAGDLGAEDETTNVSLAPALHDWTTASRLNGSSRLPNGPLTFRTCERGKTKRVHALPVLPDASQALCGLLGSAERTSSGLSARANYKKESSAFASWKRLTIDFVQPGEDTTRARAQSAGRTHGGGRESRVANGDTRALVVGCRLILRSCRTCLFRLCCSYWGSETGPRTFDILVDGIKIATQSLQNDKPGEFFDVTYAIPPEVTRGKNKITIRFQGQPGNMAGGFYGVRVIRKE